MTRTGPLLLLAGLATLSASCATRARPAHYGTWSAAAPDAPPGAPSSVLRTLDDQPVEASAAPPAAAHDHGGHGAHHAH